jgi:superfamily II DNA or RNA helicase
MNNNKADGKVGVEAADASLLSQYHILIPAQKAMLQLLAVNVDYCSLDLLSRCLNELGVADQRGRRFTLVGLRPLQNELWEKGLLLSEGNGFSCLEPVRYQAFHDTLTNGAFAAMVQVLQKYLSLPGNPPRVYIHKNYRQLIRDFQIALFFHHSLDAVNDLAYRYAFANFNDEFYENNPFLVVLNRPFSMDIVGKIDPGIRLEILTGLLNAAQSCLEPAGPIVAYIEAKYSREIPDKREAAQLLYHFLITGESARCRLLLEALGDNHQVERFGWGGFLEFAGGNFQEALSLFARAIQLLKKLTGKRKVFMPSYAGIMHLLALLQTGEDRAFKEALDHIAFAGKNSYPLLPLLEILAPVFHDRLGMVVPGGTVTDVRYFQKNPMEIFFLRLFSFWKNGKIDKKQCLILQRTRDKALQNGYLWLAAELSTLLAACGHDERTNGELAARLHASCGTRSCVDMVRPRPQWEKTLNALMHIGKAGGEVQEKRAADQRMIWLFVFDADYRSYTIIPRLQKLTAAGAWSKGRPAALKTLYRDYREMPGLTDQDRQVCRAIKEEHFRSGWGYARTDHVFDLDLALPALAGHPLIFLEDSPEVNVELVLTEPELHIKEEKGGLKLSVNPAVTNNVGDVLVIRDTPTRFKIIRFRPEHRQLIELLGKGMTIPKTAEKLVRQAVESLSGVIAVHSDLEGASRETAVPADCRPHAHILPYLEGICLEFLVKPVSDGGSSFTPGKGSRSVTAVTEGKAVQAVRDLAEEKQRLARIVESCPSLNRLEITGSQWLADDAEDALELLLELKECGDDVVLEWPSGEKLKVRRQVDGSSFSLRIGKDRDWFKASGSLEIDDTLSLDLRRLLEGLDRSTGRFIPLDDGTFLAITRSLHKRLEELRAYSEEHGSGVRFAPLAALALDDLTVETGRLQSDKAWKEHCRRLAETAIPPVPSTLQAQLRDYQATGFHWLARLSSWGVGACLADDMGLGKTVQALAAILLRASQGPTLVVAPLSVTSNWQEEAGRFAPTLNVIVFGPGDRKQTIDSLQPFDLLIVSYGLMPLEAGLLASVSWQTVVLDEAQAIKNMQTKRSRAAMELSAECRIITTGTPLENHLGELWTLFNFLNPGLLGSFKKFNEKFAIPIERDQDKEARNRLRKLIRPFILRRLKSDVLQELPAKTEITLEVEMSPKELRLYEAQRQRALESIDAHRGEEAGRQHLRILGEIMKLRRLCCNPSLILPDAGIASSKLRVFADTLGELLENNHKALIFSQFVDHLRIIREYLDDRKIGYQYLDGSTPIKQRKERIDAFQNGCGDVFLISLKAGGAGLNLTAADYVIHMDPWWNPAVEDQASDRAHRIGQERPVTVYRLVMKDSIEQQIVDLHKQKRDLADSLLEGADIAGKVSAEELLALLQQGRN